MRSRPRRSARTRTPWMRSGAASPAGRGGGSPAGLVTRAISAIDVALWDIRGKALGMPGLETAGRALRRGTYLRQRLLWRHYNLEALAETAADLVSQGLPRDEVPHGR